MSMLSKAGRYIARPVSIGLEQKATGTVQVGIKFEVDTFVGPPEEDASGTSIMGFFNLVKKDGQLNEINLRSLKDALGWDGASFATLEGETYADHQVQIVVANDVDQNGNPKLDVKYINPKDYGGGTVKKADAQVVQSLDQKYGAMLRALSGAKPGASSPKANGAKPSGTNGATNGDTLGKQLAWNAFVSKVDAYGRENPSDAYSNEQRVQVFKELLVEVTSKDPKTFSPADWVNVKKHIESDFSPATRGLIPI